MSVGNKVKDGFPSSLSSGLFLNSRQALVSLEELWRGEVVEQIWSSGSGKLDQYIFVG